MRTLIVSAAVALATTTPLSVHAQAAGPRLFVRAADSTVSAIALTIPRGADVRLTYAGGSVTRGATSDTLRIRLTAELPLIVDLPAHGAFAVELRALPDAPALYAELVPPILAPPPVRVSGPVLRAVRQSDGQFALGAAAR